MSTKKIHPQKKLDLFTAEIMRSNLVSTVEEMVETTVRSAYSTCLSEGRDFTCALFDARSRMIAQAYGIPVHSGALFDPINTLTSTYDKFESGDVIVFNDPYNGGSHQADVVVASPIFLKKELIGFAVNRGHWVDVGGMAPGGWSGTARHVIQEALIIPPVKLYKSGKLDREIQEFILKNVRLSKQCWGDIQAQIASNIVAERRVIALIHKYGIEMVLQGMEEAINYSRKRFRSMLVKLPDGEWEGTDYQEDDGHGGGPYKIHVKLKKSRDRITLDFAGSSPQVRGPVNCTFTETKAGCYTALMNVVDPWIPLNSGSIEGIKVVAPLGSIVNPTYPAPVFSTTSDPLNKVYEAVMKAMSSWLPDRVTAGSYCTMNNCTASGDLAGSNEEFIWYHFGPGGVGARLTKDGRNGDCHAMTNAKTESMEIWETRYPVKFEKFGLITDSGGPGRYRGGLGVTRQIRMLEPTFLTGCADRHQIPPWGLGGGGDGKPNSFKLIRDGKEWDFPGLYGTLSGSKFTDVPLKIDDIFDIQSGGGGGYGNPMDRNIDAIVHDVKQGYVSSEKAEHDYGVSIDPETCGIDELKTSRLRAKGRQK